MLGCLGGKSDRLQRVAAELQRGFKCLRHNTFYACLAQGQSVGFITCAGQHRQTRQPR